MSATVTARGLAAGFGARQLFSDLDLIVNPGDVVGLVGANGAGKSTLLRLLAGLEHARGRPRPAQPADGDRRLPRRRSSSGGRARRYGRSWPGAPAWPQQRRCWHDARQALAGRHPAPTTVRRGPGALAGAGRRPTWTSGRAPCSPSSASTVDLDREMTALSGGQAARAGLAALLLSRFDVFLLDEPTNDLDLDGLARLERFVADAAGRARSSGQPRPGVPAPAPSPSVVELDLAQQQVGVYGGGYAAYLAERDDRPAARPGGVRRVRRHARSDLQDRARMQRGWMEQGRPERAPQRRAGQRQDRPQVPGRAARNRRPRPGRPSG